MSRVIQLSNHDEIRDHQRSQRAKIVAAYNQDDQSDKAAKLITKAEFDEQFPGDKWERYSLQSVNKFREDICKAEGIEDPDDAFKKATSDLKPYVITDGDSKAIVFVRQKEVEE